MEMLYANICRYRIKKRWTQSDLANAMGYKDRSMIAKIEAGKVDITVGKVEEFARVLGVPAIDLIGWRDEDLSEIGTIYANLNTDGKIAMRAAALGCSIMPVYQKDEEA